MRDEKFLPTTILALTVSLIFSACQKSVAENMQIKPQSLATVSPTLSLSQHQI
jgi:hypothetical protein